MAMTCLDLEERGEGLVGEAEVDHARETMPGLGMAAHRLRCAVELTTVWAAEGHGGRLDAGRMPADITALLASRRQGLMWTSQVWEIRIPREVGVVREGGPEEEMMGLKWRIWGRRLLGIGAGVRIPDCEDGENREQDGCEYLLSKCGLGRKHIWTR